MSTAPTMQSLALYARKHFREDGYQYDDSIPSSLDVVVVSYCEEKNIGSAFARASTALRQYLQHRGRAVAQAQVDRFVRDAITFLRAAYPDARIVRSEEKRRFLSHLFWGNLVEARHASGSSDSLPAGVSSELPGPVETVTETVARLGLQKDWDENNTREWERQTIASRIETRERLVDALNDALRRMSWTFAREGKDKQLDHILQRAVVHHADETTLAKILQDVKHEIASVEEELLVRR